MWYFLASSVVHKFLLHILHLNAAMVFIIVSRRIVVTLGSHLCISPLTFAHLCVSTGSNNTPLFYLHASSVRFSFNSAQYLITLCGTVLIISAEINPSAFHAPRKCLNICFGLTTDQKHFLRIVPHALRVYS